MRRLVVFFVLAFSFFAGPAIAQQKIQLGGSALQWENLEERLDEEAKAGFSGVALVVRDGRTVLSKAYGLANRDKKIPNRLDTVFGIGSTPIDFTKAAILLLNEKGKLSLSDPIQKYLKDVPQDKQTITIEHLMTGRSGLLDFHDIPSDRDKDHSWVDRDEAVKRILSQKLLFQPGTSRKHSHSAWGLLAAILEIASGQSYPEFTREHLFKPAGMSDTGFFGEPIEESRLAIGYGAKMDGKINAPPFWGKTSWLVMGSGGQVSTAPDMLRWIEAMESDKILNEESRKRYWQGSGGVLAGGDMYGYEIQYTRAGNSLMILISNSGKPTTRRKWMQLGNDLAQLVSGRKPGKLTLGVKFGIEAQNDLMRVKVAEVVVGGAAESAGLKADDIIVKVNGESIGADPIAVLGKFLETGSAIEFELERAGARMKVTVKPKARS